MTSAPRWRSISATVDFPEAIGPVNPITYGAGSPVSHLAKGTSWRFMRLARRWPALRALRAILPRAGMRRRVVVQRRHTRRPGAPVALGDHRPRRLRWSRSDH